MKTCTSCKQEKDLGSFYRRKAAADGYQPICKMCLNASSARSRAKDTEKYALIRKKTSSKFLAEVREYKASRGCSRCPENDPDCLDLHHLDPTQKDLDPSRAVGREAFYKEAAKCIVLCSNCHRKEHARLRSTR